MLFCSYLSTPKLHNLLFLNVKELLLIQFHSFQPIREKLNSMNLLLYMSPIAVVLLLPATLIMEPNVIDVTLALGKEHKFMGVLLLLNSATAYAANLTNFLVTKHTSALTLQVLGNAKGVVAVVISILIFRNPVTFIGMTGYAVTVMGVVAYGETKRRFR
ncbi:unnamed protein product [Vicia faba]|uniref:Sugar phosphate transporter domain-containing protein n=1 Tax=Vicia faba TaxID=3906 RepID=A0AAV1AHP2_VICFA|nr:unnamed protein product [Vicia faba]